MNKLSAQVLEGLGKGSAWATHSDYIKNRKKKARGDRLVSAFQTKHTEWELNIKIPSHWFIRIENLLPMNQVPPLLPT